jgi:nicotinamidase-related amidase
MARDTIESKAWEHIIRVSGLDPEYERAALLIIDFQYLTASRDDGMFKRLREEGMAQAAEYAISRIETTAVPNTARLAQAFRGAARPVFYARCASLRGDGSDQTARHRAQGLVCTTTSKEAQILEEVAPADGDVVLTKTGSGAFTSTNLEHMLRNLGVTTLVVAGIWTNSCVETTVRHAGDLDYRVVVVEDACVAMTPENHENALAYLDNNFCVVRTTEEVVAAVSRVAELLEAH